MIKTELHVHSIFSDGALSPKDIVMQAKQAGIQLLSITDHDEVGAYHTALPNANANGIQLIPGIELNTDGKDGELHILGYFFDPDHPKMVAHIKWRKEEREIWATKIIGKLNELGYPVTLENVKRHIPGEIIVRTHIAEELAQQGYFKGAQQAYEKLLVKGKPAFQERMPFSAEDAVRLIHDCGGEAYLAHPRAYAHTVNIENLLSYGIDGIEVYHAKHHMADVQAMLEIAEKYDLHICGGSDFHGTPSRKCLPIGSIQLDQASQLRWLKRSEYRS